MKKLLLVLALAPVVALAQGSGQYRGPIIDVHLHAHTTESLANPAPNPATGQLSPKTAEEHMTRSLEIMKQRKVVVGIVSGKSVAADTCCPKFRLKLGDPLLLEDLLVKYPKLKVYVMHAGGFFPEHALMLMTMYPQIYVDIGALSWTPIAGNFLEPFLKEAKRRRLLDRVMFGSDQMMWPEAIGLAIDRVNRLDFLTVTEKQDLFYDNAAKFLGLSPQEIARHHR